METFKIFFILLLQVIAYSAAEEALGDELRNTLFKGDYMKQSIPMKKINDTVMVNVDLTITRVVDFDDDTNVVTIMGWLMISWKDFRLVWDPSYFNNLKTLRVPASSLWTPDIMLYNTADVKQQLVPTNAVVSSDGTVFWVPPGEVSYPCIPEEKGAFNCTAKVGSWTYDGYQLDLESTQLDITYLSENPKFSVSDPRVVKHMDHYKCCEEPYPNVDFSFKLTPKK